MKSTPGFSLRRAFLSLAVVLSLAAPLSAALPESKEILALIEKAADWQIANPSKHRTDDWTQAAWYTGMMALADISPSPRFLEAMDAVGRKNEWKLGPRLYHADDQAVGQMYAELFMRKRDPQMIAHLKASFDEILAAPQDGDLNSDVPGAFDRWIWCDALFMAPPVLARLHALTGDSRYLEFMVKRWWQTSGYLYDSKEHLYLRDSHYFDRKESNGRRVFWSRGNGWVMAGLARVLPYIPLAHPLRPRFEKQFCEMAEKIAELQQSDGLWRASLLDPNAYPMKESSGSGFYCFALAWGINHGYLDEGRYRPVVEKAWQALAACVNPDGKLTHVQPIGLAPVTFDAELTEVYGVGSFLLAGSEVYRLAGGKD